MLQLRSPEARGKDPSLFKFLQRASFSFYLLFLFIFFKVSAIDWYAFWIINLWNDLVWSFGFKFVLSSLYRFKNLFNFGRIFCICVILNSKSSSIFGQHFGKIWKIDLENLGIFCDENGFIFILQIIIIIVFPSFFSSNDIWHDVIYYHGNTYCKLMDFW